MMIDIQQFIKDFPGYLSAGQTKQPWEIVNELDRILNDRVQLLSAEFSVHNNIAIHKSAVVEQGVVLKGTIVISEDCFVGANAYLRGPVLLGKHVKIGPGSEIKQSVILDYTAIAHFNYIGNSIIGQHVNFEAGSICANHYNERQAKTIFVKHNGQVINTHSEKFGALVGDHAKIGANAVLSPGTILSMNNIVKRLELIEQIKNL